jgi:predicted CoA-binding protein
MEGTMKSSLEAVAFDAQRIDYSSRSGSGRWPAQVAEFLAGRRIAVAGVSRSGQEAANAVFRKLRDSGYDVVPINPLATRVEAVECFPDLLSVPGAVDALMVVTPPSAAAHLVRQAAQRGIRHVWFHRSFGQGSVSQDAIRACAEANIRPIVGGCPLMFLGPIDVGHRCMHWWLARRHLVPS